MKKRPSHEFLLMSILLWLGGCAMTPSPYGGAPVVDRSIYRTPPPQSVPNAPAGAMPQEQFPQAQVKPLPRPEPILPQQYPTEQPVPDTAYTTPPSSVPPLETPQPVPTGPGVPGVSPAPMMPPQTPPAERVSPPAPASPAPPEISHQGNQAVVALLDSASKHVKSGELDKAAASLERALRIEPRNATIWYDLAQIRLHQHQYQQAESLATKSNSLAGNDDGLRARNWRLIAVARRAMGNNVGADEAEGQAVVLGR
jgi:hypothetical protein